MEPDARDDEASVESELATTIKYLDLYLRQKIDLFLQHYVFEPFDFLGQKVMFLSVVVTLLAAGTLIVVAGAILLVATVMPLWAALLVSGVVILLCAGIIAYVFFHKQIVLQTPTAREMMNRGQT
jgi:fatty acid desaturase